MAGVVLLSRSIRPCESGNARTFSQKVIASIVYDSRCGMSDVAFCTAPPLGGASCETLFSQYLLILLWFSSGVTATNSSALRPFAKCRAKSQSDPNIILQSCSTLLSTLATGCYFFTTTAVIWTAFYRNISGKQTRSNVLMDVKPSSVLPLIVFWQTWRNLACTMCHAVYCCFEAPCAIATLFWLLPISH